MLNQTSKKMKTKEELMKEIDGLEHLAEETKEMFRRMVATMNHDLTPTQLSEYMADLNQYESEMNEFATARREGAAEQKREIARNLKENGVAPELIAKCCELPLEKIAEL